MLGIAGLITAIIQWSEVNFGPLDVSSLLCVVKRFRRPLITVGAQLIFTGFLAGLMSIKHS